MKTSDKGIAFIKSYESFRAMPYKDGAGNWTVGWGHKILSDENFPHGISPGNADALFLSDLIQKAQKPVEHSVGIDLSQQEADALNSLCFNIGAGNFIGSTLVKLLNAGATPDRVAAEFGRWDHINGVVSQGLFERRAAEADIFLNGNYVNHV